MEEAGLSEDLSEAFEISETAAFIIHHGFERVALQFPDEMLFQSAAIVLSLQKACQRLIQASFEDKIKKKLLESARLESKEIREASFIPDTISTTVNEANSMIEVSQSETSELRPKFYALADSTYGSCCVDEVAAAHIMAQAIVHYGQTCLSPTRRLPARYVFGRQPVDISDCWRQLSAHPAVQGRPLLIIPALEYCHTLPQLEVTCRLPLSEPGVAGPASVVLANAPQQEVAPHREDPQGDCAPGNMPAATAAYWGLPGGRQLEDYVVAWIGPEGAALTALLLEHDSCTVLRYDPTEKCVAADISTHSKLLRRRYYLVEKAKDAAVVGILVGTLAVAGYGEVVQQLRKVIIAAGKKPYTFVMGRPNPAKLANFPECQVFVSVACPHTVLVDSRDYLAPILTPFEAQLAFVRGKQWTGAYSLSFRELLATATPGTPKGGDLSAGEGEEVEEEEEEEPRFSFFTGGYVAGASAAAASSGGAESALALTAEHMLQLQAVSSGPLATASSSQIQRLDASSGGEYLALKRNFKGLEVKGDGLSTGHNPTPHVLQSGRTGRAAGYTDEPS